MGVHGEWVFSSLAALALQNVSNGDVGRTAFVTATSLLYEAIRPGHGMECWAVRAGTEGASGANGIAGPVYELKRTFSYLDTDIDIAALTAAINLGSPLPTGAFVLAVYADITADWTDGGSGVFSADVGHATDDDAYTPTALDIDGGIAKQTQSVCLPASGTQLIVTFTGDVNLGTMTGGAMALSVLYTVPQQTIVLAP